MNRVGAGVEMSHDVLFATEQKNQKNSRRLNAFQPLSYACEIVRWTHSRPPDLFVCPKSARINSGTLGCVQIALNDRRRRNGSASGGAKKHRMIPGMEVIADMVESFLIQR
jgi:hypothetical protein